MESSHPHAALAGITACFKFAEYATQIAEAGTENEVFVRTIQVVRADLCEVERLISIPSVQSKLILTPPKHEWVTNAIQSTKSALSEIGKWVERLRDNQQAYGTINFETRVRWVFNDHEKLVNRQHELSACHQQLSNVLNYLVPLESSAFIPPPPGYAQSMRFEDFLSPRQRRNTLSDNMADARLSATKTSRESANALPRAEDMNTHIAEFVLEPTKQLPPAQSPPPAYTKATDLRHSSSELRRKPVYSSTRELSSPDSTRSRDASLASEYGTYVDGSHDEKQSVRAYRDNTRPTRSVSELESKNFTLRATNAVGPVDPFEMFIAAEDEPLESIFGSPKFLDERGPGLSELPGDIYHPTELPAAIPPWQSSVGFRSLPHNTANANEGSISTLSLPNNGSIFNDFHTEDSGTSSKTDESGVAVYPMLYPAAGAATPSTPSLLAKNHTTSAPADSHQVSQDFRCSVHQPSNPTYTIATSERLPLEQRSRTQPSDTYSSRRMRNQKHLLDMLGWLDE